MSQKNVNKFSRFFLQNKIRIFNFILKKFRQSKGFQIPNNLNVNKFYGFFWDFRIFSTCSFKVLVKLNISSATCSWDSWWSFIKSSKSFGTSCKFRFLKLPSFKPNNSDRNFSWWLSMVFWWISWVIGWLVVDGPCGMIGMEGWIISDTLGGEVLLRLRRRVPPEKKLKNWKKNFKKILKKFRKRK